MGSSHAPGGATPLEQQKPDPFADLAGEPFNSHDDYGAQAQPGELSSFIPTTASMTRQRGWATASEMNKMDFQSQHEAHSDGSSPASQSPVSSKTYKASKATAAAAPSVTSTPEIMYMPEHERPSSAERGPTGHAVFRPQLVKPRQTFVAYRSNAYGHSIQQHINFVSPLARYQNAHKQTPSDPTHPQKAKDMYQQMHQSLQFRPSPRSIPQKQTVTHPLPRYYARVDPRQIPAAQAGVYYNVHSRQSSEKDVHHRENSDGVLFSGPLVRETSSQEKPSNFQPRALEAQQIDSADTAIDDGDDADIDDDDDDGDESDEGLFAIPLKTTSSRNGPDARDTQESAVEGTSLPASSDDSQGYDEEESDDGLFAIPLPDIQRQKHPPEGDRVEIVSNESVLENENDNDNNSSDDNGLFAKPMKPILHQEGAVEDTSARLDDNLHSVDGYSDSDDELFAIPLDGENASSTSTAGKNQGKESHLPTHNNPNTANASVASPVAVNTYHDSDSDDGLFAIPIDGQKSAAAASKRYGYLRENSEIPSFEPPPSRSNLASSGHLKPALKVNTDANSDKRPRKTASVTFHTPTPAANTSTSAGTSTWGSSTTSDPIDPSMSDHTAPSSSASSPERGGAKPGPKRRESILNDDVWASRPPVEGMIDRLDEFFPNIDLDLPYFDDAVASSPVEADESDAHNEKENRPLPATNTPPTTERVLLGPGPTDRETVITSRDTSGQETGIVTSAPRPMAVPSSLQSPTRSSKDTHRLRSFPATSSIQEEKISVPQEVYDARPPKPDRLERSNTAGSGLGRMKSIRQVAKGAHELHRKRSIRQTAAANAAARASTKSEQSTGASGARRSDTNNALNWYPHDNTSTSNGTPPEPLLRRKSTKLFGAKIMQIKPRPGARLSQLNNLEQDAAYAAQSNHQNSESEREAVHRDDGSRRHPAEVLGPKRPTRQPTFRIIRGELIGKGTFGRVYVAFNADTGDILAVKHVELNPKAVKDKHRVTELLSTLDREIDTMQHLEHPNIVQFLGCERGETSVSIFLEYIPGGSIGSCLRKHGKFEENVVRSLTMQTLSGLAYLHDQGILHRDLKADNILIDLDGSCKISDFGISKKTDNIYGKDATNSMQGSVFWMAPEVVQGGGYSAKVDIWSLGCVVLEMFAGRRPWGTEEAVGAIFKLGSLNQAPPIPDDVALSISPVGIGFMHDCLTIDPPDRPTATTLLSHPFCITDPQYNFFNTHLYAKIRHVVN